MNKEDIRKWKKEVEGFIAVGGDATWEWGCCKECLESALEHDEHEIKYRTDLDLAERWRRRALEIEAEEKEIEMDMKLLRIKEVAEILDMTESHVSKLMRAGKIPGALKVGARSWRVARGDLMSWIKSKQANSDN